MGTIRDKYPSDVWGRGDEIYAFLARYAVGLTPGAAAILYSFHEAWNGTGGREHDIGALWGAMVDVRFELGEYARTWSQALALQSDLASSLVKFASDLV